MAVTLYRGGRVDSPADPHATALLTDGDTIRWVGDGPDCPDRPDTIVDLDGALVAPAFVDAHTHATTTGVTLTGLDLTACRSAAELLDAVSAAAADRQAGPGGVVLGRGWDESTWDEPALPGLAALDRAAGGRPVFLDQASGHSALCGTAMTALVPDVAGLDGHDPAGWHKRDAHTVLRRAAFAALGTAGRTAAQRATLDRAAALGIACLHECGGPVTSSADDLAGLLALAAEPGRPEVIGYWGELGGAATAQELGAAGAAGDLYADGALGSQDAHLTEPYADTGGHGHGFLTAEQVCDHIVDCTMRDLQGGFHAIGDAAVATVLDGFADAARKLGTDRLRDTRHRIEHAEILDKALIARFVEFGVVASVQPGFDRLWGGAGQMYQTRLGLTRALASNPFGSLAGVGVPLAFGSDSPVTPLDPWGTVRAATEHHNPTQRIGVRAAFAAHTRGGWRAARRDSDGTLVPGAPATFAVWDCPAGLTDGLPTLTGDAPVPACRRTVRQGETIFTAD